MTKAVSVSMIAAMLTLSLAPSLLAAPIAAPSKEDIIDALGAKPSDTNRGFVQAPTNEPTTKSATVAKASGAAAHASIGVPILFDVNSAAIKPESRPTLDNIAAALQSPTLKNAKIQLEGHTDSSGKPASNLELSRERAMAVREFLVSVEGLPSDRLTTIGKGQSEPANPANPIAPENRRVVLVNLSN